MIDLGGREVSAEERELLRHPLIGGVILFTRNYLDPQQLTALVSAIHAVRSPPLIVAVVGGFVLASRRRRKSRGSPQTRLSPAESGSR